MGGEEGVGIDGADAFVLEIAKDAGVDVGIFLIGNEVEVGYGTHEDVVDAGGAFDARFTSHTRYRGVMKCCGI